MWGRNVSSNNIKGGTEALVSLLILQALCIHLSSSLIIVVAAMCGWCISLRSDKARIIRRPVHSRSFFRRSSSRCSNLCSRSESNRTIHHQPSFSLNFSFDIFIVESRVEILSSVPPSPGDPARLVVARSSLSQGQSLKLLLLGISSGFDGRTEEGSSGRSGSIGFGIVGRLDGEWVEREDAGGTHPWFNRS